MKIGIMTFHRAINYGAILQTYALYAYLSSQLHADVEIVDYRNVSIELSNKPFGLKSVLDRAELRRLIRHLISNGQFYYRRDKFDHFISSYVKLSAKKFSNENIKGLEKEYDLLICGSDQIWNGSITGYDSNYFLTFFPKYRISYAASFGIDHIPVDKRTWYRDNLLQLHSISVRENSGKEIVYDLTGKEVPSVVDPTMLLSKRDWRLLEKGRIYREGKYILLYSLVEDKKLNEFAKVMSQQTGYKLVSITNRIRNPLYMKTITDAFPSEWLYLIDRSKCVITNSFHGIVFSLIFNKNFYVNLLPNVMNVNARIIDLLKSIDLEDRICTADGYGKCKEIDYRKVQESLNKRIRESKDYLIKAIAEGK